MPQIRHDIQQLAALGDIYADAAPDLLDFLNNAVTTARTLHRQQKPIWMPRCWPRPGWATPVKTSSVAVGRICCGALADLVAHRPAARHLQPRNLLHHPQLPRHRTQATPR